MTISKWTVIISLISFSGFQLANADDGRKNLKEVVTEISNRSALTPLDCEEWSLHTPAQKMWYTLTTEIEPNYQDAYFIELSGKVNRDSDKIDHAFSTLIAYEGQNGHIMGNLKIWKDGNTTIYEHTFSGFFDDVLRITLVDGHPTQFAYRKVNPQKVDFYKLNCQL